MIPILYRGLTIPLEIRPKSLNSSSCTGKVNEAAEDFKTMERRFQYTTPKSFLELIYLYRNMLDKERTTLFGNIDRLRYRSLYAHAHPANPAEKPCDAYSKSAVILHQVRAFVGSYIVAA